MINDQSSAEIQGTLIAISKELLQVDEVDPDDDFLALGANSRALTRMTFRISEQFGVELPLRTVFNQPTVAQLTAAIVSALGQRDNARSASGS
jgi:acyl carrier protein